LQAILSQFSQKKKATVEDEDTEEVDDAALFKDLLDDDNTMMWDEDNAEPEDGDEVAIAEAIEGVDYSNRAPVLSSDDVKLGRFSIFKVSLMSSCHRLITNLVNSQLQTLANKIVNSPTIKADIEACCLRSLIKPALMIRDVSTRWNSTSELIGWALYLQPALQMLVIMREHNKPRGVSLQRFQLSEAEWELLIQLHPLLDVRLFKFCFTIQPSIVTYSYSLMQRNKFLRIKCPLSTTSSRSLTS
jgi:hypothetical protein